MWMKPLGVCWESRNGCGRLLGRDACLFHAADTRSRAELEEMLGAEFAGVLSSDDYSVYNGYAVKHQQKCLAHLRRHFKKVIHLGHGNNPQLGQEFLDLIDEAFAQHQKWRETRSCGGVSNVG